MPSNCKPIIVAPDKWKAWTVCYGSNTLGPYADYNVALKIAYSEAAAARWNGRAVKIAVIGEDGDTIAEYCMCRFARFAA
jgi:hypothetical protein